MFKLAGIICILAGCMGWGISRIGEEKSRVRYLREMIRIIRRIRDEISYGKHTMPEICLILSEHCDYLYQPYFKQIHEQMNREKGASFNSIWEQQIGQCLCSAPLSEDEKDILRNLPQNVGMQEEKLQAESIGRSAEMLVRNCRKAEDAYDNKAKMIFSVSILTGIFITILLI